MGRRGVPAAERAADTPPDLVVLGIVRGAYGVKGWTRLALLGSDGTALQTAPLWWVESGGVMRAVQPSATKRHGAALLAKWPGCETKEEADALKGSPVSAPRSAFPSLADGEYYWADLPGCRVINRDGEELGRVTGLRENSGGQWLEVNDGVGLTVMLIPLVEQYVDAVDPAQRIIRVDWGRDW